MKSIFTAILFCLSIHSYGQNQTITILKFNETVTIDTIELQLISVVDSRCPRTVNCIRAGEALVVVDLFKDGKFLKQQTLTFYPTPSNKSDMLLYASNGLNISGLNVLPHPDGQDKINEKDYFLELAIEN